MPDTYFRIEMLAARQGDSLWIEYGKGAATRRILIDGGPIGAVHELDALLNRLPEGDRRIELMVISHVDTDHIEGIIRLMAEKRAHWPVAPKDIWFNGWRHLQETGMLGGREGDFLSALIRRRASDEWNRAFGGQAVVINPDSALPVIMLRDDMKLTLLSPYPDMLEEMAGKWQKDVEKHGLHPGDLDAAWDQLVETTKFHPEDGLLGGGKDFEERLRNQLKTDQSLANGTSIAFLAEFGGKSCLFLADAHADSICQSVEKIIPAGKKRLKVDALKMSHHGSRANISGELLGLVDAKHYLISTSGAIHEHPDREALEAVIHWSVRKPVFWFNYRTEQTLPWKDGGGDYTARYPKDGKEGIQIRL